MKYKAKIIKTIDWDVALDSARFTINKPSLNKLPSDSFIKDMCISEHSPLSEVRYIVEVYDIETFASQHIARHDAFAGHNLRESKDVHFVGTQRSDRTGVDRSKRKQTDPCDHRISLSAKDFITISKLRLCSTASVETRGIWQSILNELKAIDPILYKACVPTCIYRGFCTEKKSCKYDRTEAFKDELLTYRKFFIENYED